MRIFYIIVSILTTIRQWGPNIMANILSIQSTVLNDLVGNQAARTILQPRKHNLIEVPTIILTSHKRSKIITSAPFK